jgi:HSP20 family protein
VQIPFEVNADKAEASFKNGVLMVKLPKVEAAKPREVKIKLK